LFCDRWFKNEPFRSLIVLVGESRSGKTHVAKAIARFCRAASLNAFESGNWGSSSIPSIYYGEWPVIVDSFKEGNYGAMDSLMDDDLVVLDDIGAEHDPSKNAVNKLCQILTRREKRFTVITTNVPMSRWPATFDTRVADRLVRNSVVIDLFGVPTYGMQ
jgi:DNA replication protein DnaC